MSQNQPQPAQHQDPCNERVEPDQSPPAPVAADVDAFCPWCGYNLRGLAENRCPECSKAFDPDDVLSSGLPWVTRHTLGRGRAMLRTFWMATFGGRKFVHAASRPQPVGPARRFRTVVLTVAAAVIAVELAVGVWFRARTLGYSPGTLGVGLILAAAGALAFWGWTMAASNITTWFAAPASMSVEQRNRCIALSYYTVAPALMWIVPIGCFAWAMGTGLEDLIRFAATSTSFMAGTLTGGFVLLWAMLAPPITVAAMTRRGAAGMLTTLLLMPLLHILGPALLTTLPALLLGYGWLALVVGR